ncbi:hypothetical protein I6F35_21995 [Bradyrhizobium sp. BRP22]|uniref:hypothetical protein n=1 Tax=Bradyrhizobium sp. BRP22 TaxID=2793821 RepID=UPI001CD72C19|nr:hypothetical protein [Bradyrhizobium sp. BRP22]MCA1455843.1 hypothetical protein [Bradyrhizobium sp. BRP22]
MKQSIATFAKTRLRRGSQWLQGILYFMTRRRRAEQSLLAASGRRLRVILALLAVEVRAVVVIAAVLGAEALLGGPSLNQRPIHRKVLV